jgi:leader peptidase (prepilin peptidase) / N-methyltransferase
MIIVLAGIAGLLIGSFLNVVIYRLPRHESLISPGSHCPACDAPVKPYDNIPVISWLLLRGKCRKCGTSISMRYPAVELTTAALVVVVALARHSAHDIALGIALVFVLVPVTLIDFDHRIIPNVILGPAAIAALVIGAITRPSGIPEQLIAGAAAGLFFFIFALAYPKGMGMGDVKLAAVLGLFLGRSVAVAILIGLITAVVVGGVVMARLGVAQGRKTGLPFGPFLAIGGIVAILVGPEIVHSYLHSVN